MGKVLSVIIPTYNMERYLEKCLSSLVVDNKHMDLLDIIVVNDGSKDGSLQIAKEFASRFPDSITIIDKENGNYGSCINSGLQVADGKYIKVLDADDSFDNDNFVEYLDFLSSTDVDSIISNVVLHVQDGSILRTISYDLPEDELLTLGDLGNYQWTIQMHSVCYKTDILRSIGYKQTEGISYTDQEWMFLPMSYSQSLAYYPESIYMYLVGRDGQTIDPRTWGRNLWQEIEGIKVMIEERMDHQKMTPEAGRTYQDIRIKSRIRTVYMAYFLKFKTFDNNDLMCEFDGMVKQYDRPFYDVFDNYHVSRIIPYRYIKAWRKNEYKPTCLHKLNRLAYCVLCKIKRTPQY